MCCLFLFILSGQSDRNRIQIIICVMFQWGLQSVFNENAYLACMNLIYQATYWYEPILGFILLMIATRLIFFCSYSNSINVSVADFTSVNPSFPLECVFLHIFLFTAVFLRFILNIQNTFFSVKTWFFLKITGYACEKRHKNTVAIKHKIFIYS